MKKQLSRKLFARFYWGITSQRESKQVFDSEESEKMMQKQWENAMSDAEFNNADFDSEKVYRNITKQIASENKFLNMQQSTWFKIAAVFILALTTFVFTYNYFSSNNVEYITEKCETGRFKEIHLADNSVVWLKNGSQIRFQKNLDGNTRKIDLVGEAYFEVSHNPEKAFIVSTSEMYIKVYGTKFNVRAYPNEEKTSATLFEGKISVKEAGNKQESFVAPGQIASLNKQLKQLKIENIETGETISWKNNILKIENLSFGEMCEELERWYNVKIQLDKTLHTKYKFTLTLQHETIEDALQLIKQSTPDLNIQTEKNTIHINQTTK